MEQQIRFCTSADGARIAYATMGDGPLLVCTPDSWESTELVFSRDIGEPFFGPLAERFRVVRYDRRGTGMSDRARQEFGIEADVADLEGVAQTAGGPLALFASFHLGPAAIAFSARHPESVTGLILYNTYARGAELTSEEIRNSLIALARSHWGMASRNLADVIAPGVDERIFERIVRDERQSASGQTVARLLEEGYQTDVTGLLPQIQAPTLVLHRRGARTVPLRVSRELAAAIPNAQLTVLEGIIHYPWFGDSGAVVSAILDFLSPETGVEQTATKDSAGARRATAGSTLPEGTAAQTGLTVILFADIADSTALTERLGDDAFRARARELDGALRAVIRENGGTPIEGRLLGDGVLAVFPSARRAIEAALACGRSGDEAGLPLHLGLHAGDVIREENPDGRGDVYGGAVNIAARVSALSAPGEVLVSQTVRDLARTSAGVGFEERGQQRLKGVSDPVHVYEVRQL
jgi:class 3 adenylate cyclase/pimeloyl-ACP methyl ester carboxylesterase